ncbi:ATP-grasp domain-containing protein [Paenarthrobacter sp. NPDC056912]|uniref:ATP-grasp domain-containing protein n=1 Tax=Paenarthrobacter sp. NPDC056912 TaxID=3345965 RepID=UPI0036704AE7
MRVLVTGVGGPAGLSLARQLMDQGHWVLGVDMQPVHGSAADAVTVVSPSNSPGYLWELRGLVAANGIELVVPTVSDELVLLSEARDCFAPGVEVLIADPAPVRIANDKYFTMKCLSNAGVAVPGFGLPGDFSSVNEAMARFGGTLVVKPRVSRGGRGVRILERAADGGRNAARIWSSLDDSWIVQRFAPGTEYAPVVLRHATESEEHNLVVVLEKTELKDGRVGNAISVRRMELSAAADVAHVAGAAAAALGLTGPIDIDIRRLPDGTPVVLEVNARFGANSAYAPELLEGLLRRHVPGQVLGRTI